MNDDHSSEAALLRFVGSHFDAQRAKLRVSGDDRLPPDFAAVARQISDLGKIVTSLGDELLSPSADPDRSSGSARMRTGFTAVLHHAGDAISALGTAVHQLALLDEEAPLGDQRDVEGAEKAAAQAVAEALSRADTALGDAGDLLHAAGTSTTARRLHAARSQSPAASPLPGPPLPPAPPSTGPANRTARGR